MTTANDLMQEVVTRIAAAVAPLSITNVRRDHFVAPIREETPAVYVIAGDNLPVGNARGCALTRQQLFTVEVYVRDDAGYESVEAMLQAVLTALNPDTAYVGSGNLEEPKIRRNRQEVADADSLRTDMLFAFTYQTSPWSL